MTLLSRFVLLSTLVLASAGYSLAKTTVANTPGNWTNAGTWSNGVPASGDAVTINVAVVYNTNFAMGGSGSITVSNTGSLIDATGGTAYDLTIQNTADIIFQGTVRIEGTFTLENNTDLVINGCDTLEFGDAVLENNGLISVDSCAAMFGNGDMEIKNNITIAATGFLRVNGNVDMSNSASISGVGNIFVTTCMTFRNSASAFGDNTDCCTNCFYGTGFPLPIQLLYFIYEENDTEVLFEWASTEEINFLEYHLQRSEDARHWETIDIQAGASRGQELVTYHITDLHPVGAQYYRLMMLDRDGSTKFSDLIAVEGKAAASPTHWFHPNPAHSNIFFGERASGKPKLLLDLQGKLIRSTSENSMEITSIPRGVYILRMEDLSEKIVID